MRQARFILVAAIAAMLALPAGSATWSAFGDHEPDNSLDDPTFIWSDAPGTETQRIYFNGWATSFGVNPNVGALQTRNEIPTLEQVSAILGVWVDCNGDGYVGLAESAAYEYDARLLLDTSVCPATSGSTQKWAGGHNYRGWVSELIPIGNTGGDADDDVRDTRTHRDPAVKVWGDFGIPGDSVSESGSTCALNPLPRGTMQSTGGALNYADCGNGVLEAWNTAILTADETNSLGLAFQDEDDATVGGHPLHVGTFGSDNSENAAVRTSDCNAPRALYVGDLMNQTIGAGTAPESPVRDITIWQPAPSLGNTNDPTLAGQVNRTNEETEFGSNGCDTSNDAGGDFYILEGDDIGSGGSNELRGKRAAEWNFNFFDSNRGGAPVSVLFGGAAGAPESDAGITLLGAPTTVWSGGSTLVKLPSTVRASVGDGTVGFADPYYLTFYAYVGSAVTSKGFITPGGSGVYASEQCGPNTSGVFLGWNCDASEWYLNPDGSTQDEAEGGSARPGDVYQLRDIDCADGGNAAGVPLGTPGFGDNPCA